jgi:hypothetical protein
MPKTVVSRPLVRLALLPVAAVLSACSAHAAPTQRLLLSALEDGDSIRRGGWQMSALSSSRAATPAKFGSGALTFGGVAQGAGSKGDYAVANEVPGTVRALSLWAHAAPNSNVSGVGLQIQDAEGESLLVQSPVDWEGWKNLRFDLAAGPIAQSYPQADKNKKIDGPIKSVHIIWFARAAGPSQITVDELAAETEFPEPHAATTRAAWSGSRVGSAGQPFGGRVLLTNFAPAASASRVEYVIQRVGSLYLPPAPDAVDGTDHARGAKSWSEANGARLEEGSLSDGRDWTSASLPWGSHTEALQFVDLGRARNISKLGVQQSDANWAWNVDVSASADGKTYQPVAGLQNVDMHGKWGRQVLAPAAPFSARFLRLRHHKGGEKVNAIAMPASLSVYDGVADEKWELPSGTQVLARGVVSPNVPANSYAAAEVASPQVLGPGAYLVALKIESGGQTQVLHTPYMVKPTTKIAGTPDSRFGLNTAVVELAPLHRELGVGWVRFENMKWPMMSPAPNDFRFDGSVTPWVVNHDAIVEGYAAQGLSVLPFLFLTPDYASSAPADVKPDRRGSYPPKDNALMADFVFQTVARYGSAKHPAAVLKSPDKKSGLNRINTYEIWNEPNLTAPSWGPWVGTAAQYMEMFRPAAEAVKRADAKAKVTNGGYAGIEVETVEPLRTHVYADGKRPLDFVDILNVHYYSGRSAPETATVDANVDRSGNMKGARTYEDSLRRLIDWRDEHKAGMPIWLTETGYDSAGPFGTDEATQAARLPRVIMMALAAGIDKVFVYRESGSDPSQHAASGLQRNDGALKPSWFTYATLIRHLDGVSKGVRLPHPNPNVRLYLWTRGKESVLSAWTVDGDGELGLDLGAATIVDAFGAERKAPANAKLPLSPFPVYLRGWANGAPLQVLGAQAQRTAQAAREEKARLSKVRAYLFDFGGVENNGSIEIGTNRPFTPVLHTQTFDAARGWGFTPGAAASDGERKWIRDALESDHTRMNKGTRFQVQAAPGRYRLSLGAEPVGDTPRFIVRGAVGGDKYLPLAKDKASEELLVEVGAEPISIEPDGYADLKWLSLIAQTAPANGEAPAQK